MGLILVVLGGAVGAVLRYLTYQAVQARPFPWGTWIVNVAGSLVLGVVTGVVVAGAAPQSVQLLVGVGFCGALTTYSTFSYETVQLAESGAVFTAVVYVASSVTGALGAALTGAALAQTGWP